MYQRPHERLVAWKEGYNLCLEIYKVTKEFPSDERFGLTSQMRRSAYGIPTNIAEGNTKKSMKERAHFFEIAHASLEELHCECRLAKDLEYIDEKILDSLDTKINRVSFLLHRLRSSLQ